MGLPNRFSDGEYRNWVKCGVSLMILKEGLHEYIDKGVKKLHEDIKQKVSSYLGGSGILIACQTCSSKKIHRIRATSRNRSRWTINCASNVCNVWLDEILAFHNEPESKTINWSNSDITMWPADPYEIAKIFMPKGQDKKRNLPEELDVSAVLSVLKHCSFFKSSISNFQILTDLIDIRNRLCHSGDLRVSDAQRDSWIDKMLQLVADLNIQGTIYSNLSKVKTLDIDTEFRKTEISALKNMVACFSSDLENVHDEMSTLHSTISCNSGETEMKTQELETDIKNLKEQVNEFTRIADQITSFLGKNPDIVDANIMESVRSMEKDVNNLRNGQYEIETAMLNMNAKLSSFKEKFDRNLEETKTNFQRVEKKQENTEIQLQSIKTKVCHEVSSIDKRVNYFHCIYETNSSNAFIFVLSVVLVVKAILALNSQYYILDQLLEATTAYYDMWTKTLFRDIIMLIGGILGFITVIFGCIAINGRKTRNRCFYAALVMITLICNGFVFCQLLVRYSKKTYEAREPLDQQITSRNKGNSSHNDAFGVALNFAQTKFNCFWKNNFQNVGKWNWTLVANETSAYNTVFENQTNGKQPKFASEYLMGRHTDDTQHPAIPMLSGRRRLAAECEYTFARNGIASQMAIQQKTVTVIGEIISNSAPSNPLRSNFARYLYVTAHLEDGQLCATDPDCFDAILDSMNRDILSIGFVTALLSVMLFQSCISTLCLMSRKKYQHVTEEEMPLLSK